MILAGIDEAGLGPPLGPLATARAVLETPDDWDPAAPWDRLSRSVVKRAARTDPRLVVDDSKAVHAARGVSGLERTVLVFLHASGKAFFFAVWAEDEESPNAAFPYPWHAGCFDSLPFFPENRALLESPQLFKPILDDLAATGAAVVEIAVRLAGPIALNKRFASGENKNLALLRETGRHLSRIAASAGEKPSLVIVDKQGGRNSYLPFLSKQFPGSWISAEVEGADASRYRLSPNGGGMRLSFQPRAEAFSFPTALASMAAKYARELAMAAFNRWFCERIPGIRPTAGYPLDAKRWLSEADSFFTESGIARDRVVRAR
ncbi:MAG: hypothetical protein LBT97_13315 [Planctomycetota bacterium]|jgi:ribonuclease HII|nr:hypothetical protein [Planctomycetota bacterium]